MEVKTNSIGQIASKIGKIHAYATLKKSLFITRRSSKMLIKEVYGLKRNQSEKVTQEMIWK